MGRMAGRFAMIKSLQRLNLLGPDTTYIHCCYFSDEEWQLVKDTGGRVSIASQVEMQMGHGQPPVGKALKYGLRPSLSIDVVTTVPGDMFTEIRSAFAAERVLVCGVAWEANTTIPESTLTHRGVLEMATTNGAYTVGLGLVQGLAVFPYHGTAADHIRERSIDLLSANAVLVGVDEHTAAIFDIDAGTVSIRGRGGLTWRRKGASQRFENGTTVPLSALATGLGPVGDPAPASAGADTRSDREIPIPTGGVSPFLEEVARQSDAADTALASGDVDGAVGAVLAIDSQIHDWAADTLDSDEQDRARETLRRYVVRLGDLARNGTADPRDLIGPVVDRILDLRVQMRGAGEYALADKLRDALVDAGVAVHDTPAGSTWDFAAASAD